jgi:hypothetical protein
MMRPDPVTAHLTRRRYLLAQIDLADAQVRKLIRTLSGRCDLLCPGDVCQLGHVATLIELRGNLAVLGRYRDQIEAGRERPVVEER